MLPQLTTHNDGGPTAVAVPPPPHFKPLIGLPRVVKLNVGPWTSAREGLTAAQKNGLRYEDKVQCKLVAQWVEYNPSPRVHFLDDSGYRTIIPDGLMSLSDRVYIVEVKSQHMPEAWWQLDQLYRPVLQARRPMAPIHCVEICRSYDPAMPFPIKPDILSDVAEVLEYRGRFAVLPWKL